MIKDLLHGSAGQPSAPGMAPLTAGSPFHELARALETEYEDVQKGRRIGMFRLMGVLGSGHFAKVVLGEHILTRGSVPRTIWCEGCRCCFGLSNATYSMRFVPILA
jgi:hypothetical protein